MDDSDIAVIVDDRGILLLGDERQVEALVAAEGLATRALNAKTMALAGRALQVGGELTANYGRWVKLTPESAALVRRFGPSLSKGEKLMTGVVRAGKGQIAKFLKFEGRALLNPSLLGGVGGIMAQLALEQAIAEVTDYLKSIDKKLDQVLQDQKDQALADLIGISLSIDEAMSIRSSVGGVSSTTWSKVQATSTGLVRAQALALQKVEGFAAVIEQADGDVGKIDSAAAQAKRDVRIWLGILAKAVQLQDKLAVLELDRVLEDEPDQVSLHQEGLRHARSVRLDRVAQVVDALTDRLRTAAELSSGQKFINPFGVTRVILSTNEVSRQVLDFEDHLDLQARDAHDLTDPDWGESALKLLGDTAENARALGQGAIGGVLGLGGRLVEARDRFIL